VGAVLFFFALGTFLWPVNEGLTLGWTSPAILGSFGFSAVLWALFINREVRCPEPLCDLNFFRNRNFLSANLAALVMMLAFSGTEFLLPFFFEGVIGYRADIAGILLAIPAVALMIFGPVAGALSDRIGSRIPATVSALFAAGTFFFISTYSADTGIIYIIASLLCLGVALGVFFPPNMNQILGQSRHEEEGVASSIMMTMKNVGSTVGVAIMGTIAIFTIVHTKGFDPTVPATAIPVPVLVAGFGVAFLSAALFCVLAVVFSAIAKDAPV
jgi:MFS family permease